MSGEYPEITNSRPLNSKIPDAGVVAGYDRIAAEYPHCDDPRYSGLKNMTKACKHYLVTFFRCARELGEEDPHCKYQFYRCQVACPVQAVNEYMERRAKGVLRADVMPDRMGHQLRRLDTTRPVARASGVW